MKVNGIIAEYNPFHNGHLYHLETVRELTGADYTVVVMSGNFVQRGAPALLQEHVRAEMALRCGADLVLELPAYYAAGSAEFFADGAVALLDRLGVVDFLCFGSECGQTRPLTELAAVLVKEPPEYQAALRRHIKEGRSFPQARAMALAEQCPSLADIEALSSPNNLLGVEYCKALLRRRSPIRPVTIPRQGADYYQEDARYQGADCSQKESRCQGADCSLEDARYQGAAYSQEDSRHPSAEPVSGDPLGNLSFPWNRPSALSLRNAVLSHTPPEDLAHLIPPAAFSTFQQALEATPPMESRDFSLPLYYRLLSDAPKGYRQYLDVSPELSDRIGDCLDQFEDFDSFCGLLKHKNLTYTRISRCLLHILLQMETEKFQRIQALDLPYARVLGLRQSASPLLSAIKRRASLPLISKAADAGHFLEGEALEMFREDLSISHLYNALAAYKANSGILAPSGRPYAKRAPRSEYRISPVVLP